MTSCVFTLGDARSFFGLTSKIPPLGSTVNFDADVKEMTARHQCGNRLNHAWRQYTSSQACYTCRRWNVETQRSPFQVNFNAMVSRRNFSPNKHGCRQLRYSPAFCATKHFAQPVSWCRSAYIPEFERFLQSWASMVLERKQLSPEIFEKVYHRIHESLVLI